MNSLFVFRNLFPRTLFCARKLSQGHSYLQKFYSHICRLPDSSFFSFKNDLKSRFFVAIQTMSNVSGDNSSLLDNLRKSVKEQVGANTSHCWNRKLMSLDILILVSLFWYSSKRTQTCIGMNFQLSIFGNLNGSEISSSRRPVHEYFQSVMHIGRLFWASFLDIQRWTEFSSFILKLCLPYSLIWIEQAYCVETMYCIIPVKSLWRGQGAGS